MISPLFYRILVSLVFFEPKNLSRCRWRIPKKYRDLTNHKILMHNGLKSLKVFLPTGNKTERAETFKRNRLHKGFTY